MHIGGKRGGGGLTSLRMSSEEGDEQPLLLDRGGSQLTIVVDACNVGLQLQADESGGIASLIQTRQKQRSLVEMLPELERLAAVAAQENHTVTFVFDGKSQFGQYADKTFEIKGKKKCGHCFCDQTAKIALGLIIALPPSCTIGIDSHKFPQDFRFEGIL